MNDYVTVPLAIGALMVAPVIHWTQKRLIQRLVQRRVSDPTTGVREIVRMVHGGHLAFNREYGRELLASDVVIRLIQSQSLSDSDHQLEVGLMGFEQRGVITCTSESINHLDSPLSLD